MVMDFVPHEFNDVPYGSIVAAACAPRDFDPRFKGIAIRTPEAVYLEPSEAAALPICGYYQLDTGPLVAGAVMQVHVRSLDYPGPGLTGQVVVQDEAPDEPIVPMPGAEAPVDPRLYAGQLTESYFYVDAQKYLAQKLVPGRYEVCVTYGAARSNVASITVRLR